MRPAPLRGVRHLLMRLVDTHGGDRQGDRGTPPGGTSEGSHRPIRMAGAARDLGEVELSSCNGRPMTRYFPGLVESLKPNLPSATSSTARSSSSSATGWASRRCEYSAMFDQADEGSGGRLALPPFEICLDRAIVKRRPGHLPGPLQWGLARR